MHSSPFRQPFKPLGKPRPARSHPLPFRQLFKPLGRGAYPVPLRAYPVPLRGIPRPARVHTLGRYIPRPAPAGDMLTVRFGQLTVEGLSPSKIHSLAGCSHTPSRTGCLAGCSHTPSRSGVIFQTSAGRDIHPVRNVFLGSH